MSETETIQQIILGALKQPTIFDAPEGRTFVALPNEGGGYDLENITSNHKADVVLPKLVTQAVRVQTVMSLIEYTNRFKNADTVLFADINANRIISMIDYHQQPEANALTLPEGVAPGRDPSARLNAHRATLDLPFSQEWMIWKLSDGKLMRHVDFATFLEENSFDITTPAGADLLETCRDLQVKSGMNFNSSIRMGDTVSIEFQKGDDVATKDNIALPTKIELSIPVYFGEAPVKMTAFLRRKVDDGHLLLGYALSRAENVRQAEFHRVVDEVSVGVDHLTTVYGTPS